MTTYDVYLRDRDIPLTIEADHYEIDLAPDGQVRGFEFLKGNSGPPTTSITPQRVLYVLASETVAVSTVEPSRGAQSGAQSQEAASSDDPLAVLGKLEKLVQDGLAAWQQAGKR